jgi:hypothetical protein
MDNICMAIFSKLELAMVHDAFTFPLMQPIKERSMSGNRISLDSIRSSFTERGVCQCQVVKMA